MNNQPIDKGRIMAVVDYYQAKENGQALVNQDGSPKMKPKWWAIGECTKWQGDSGEYVTRTIYCDPRVAGKYEQREFWDSENQNNQAAPQQGGFQQPAQQSEYAQQSGGFQQQGNGFNQRPR